MKKLIVLAIALLMGVSAYAAPNLRNFGQQADEGQQLMKLMAVCPLSITAADETLNLGYFQQGTSTDLTDYNKLAFDLDGTSYDGYNVTGTVTDNDGALTAGITLTWQWLDGTTVLTQESDGSIDLTNVNLGEFSSTEPLTFTCSDKTYTFEVTNVDVAASATPGIYSWTVKMTADVDFDYVDTHAEVTTP